jgi:GIY-YIG catalytic domain
VKVCKICKVEKSLTEFSKSRTYLRGACKECRGEGYTKAFVYKLVHLPTDTCYIGQSVNLEHRLEDHLSRLKGKYHNCSTMQALYKDDPENFVLEILEPCSFSKRLTREKWHIQENKTATNHRVYGEKALQPPEKSLLKVKLPSSLTFTDVPNGNGGFKTVTLPAWSFALGGQLSYFEKTLHSSKQYKALMAPQISVVA